MAWREFAHFGKARIDRPAFGQPGNVNEVPSDVSFSIAAGGANVSEITIQMQNGQGQNVAAPAPFLVWLSDADTGVGLTGTSASGTVTAKSASGQDMGALTAKKALMAQPLADGSFILQITDTAKTAFYVAVQLPSGGRRVSRVLATADYG